MLAIFIDTTVAITTALSVAVSLAFGAKQIIAGLKQLPLFTSLSVSPIVVVILGTALTIASLKRGMRRGILATSKLTISCASILLLYTLLTGPTETLLYTCLQSARDYLQQLPTFTFGLRHFENINKQEWMTSWTTFYWAWWIAWAPFVGTFIARISKGRTVRSLVFSMLSIPTITTVIWFSVFGKTASQFNQLGIPISAAIATDPASGIFLVLSQLPLPSLTILICLVSVAAFYVSSADSAILSICAHLDQGRSNDKKLIVWAIIEAIISMILISYDGSSLIQAILISFSLPLCLLLLASSVFLLRSMVSHHRIRE